MNNEKTILSVVIGIVMLLVVLLIIFQDHDWSVQYDTESKEPYGLYIFHDMVKRHSGEENVIPLETKIADTLRSYDDASYLFIGTTHFVDSADQAAILDFVKKGNVALIVSQYRSTVLDPVCGIENEYTVREPEIIIDTNVYWDPEREEYDTVFYEREVEWEEEEYYDDEDEYENYFTRNFKREVTISLGDTSTTIFRRNARDTVEHRWNFFADDTTCGAEVLGRVDGDPNLIRIKVGEGELYLHHTPIVFTNYFAKEEFFLNYYNEILGRLNSRTILWDEDSRYSDYQGGGGGSQENATPLKELLQIENFRWAWYTLLIMFALMMVFGAKRKQRIIPIIKHKTNTSKEYIQTIGSLYFQSEDHASLAKLKLKLFNQHLVNRYGIKLSELEQDQEKLSLISGVDIDLIRKIAKKQRALSHLEHASDDFLISLYLSIEKFMSHGK